MYLDYGARKIQGKNEHVRKKLLNRFPLNYLILNKNMRLF